MGRDIRNTDYFTADNLAGLSRVDEHLSFVEGIAEKYQHTKVSAGNVRPGERKSGGDWEDIRRQLDFIRRKKNDRKLNISVIGEFSTGKSTFINALLRRELLASSALQGTTVASTVIDYSERYEIELEYLDRRSGERFSYTCFRELKKELERFTTDSSVARLLKSVNVFLPAEILKNDFRIIDTPGTNVTEAWHEDVTVRALREKSDLSIILTSAEKPVPNTMIGFVKKNLESILPQCVFVVTKLDMIRPRERDRQIAYIKMRLGEELEIPDAPVLPYVSPMVLGGERSIEDGPAEEKKRLCIVGSYGEDKCSLAEALLKGRIPDIFKKYFVAPILKFTYGAELSVKVKLNEPVDSDFFEHCPSGLKYIIQKHNRVNLPEIEVRYSAFCDLLRKLDAFSKQTEKGGERRNVFSSVSVELPMESLKNEYDIVVCEMGEFYSNPAVQREMNPAVNETTDIIILLNAARLWSSEEKNFIHRCSCGGRLILAVDHMEQVRQEDIPAIKAYCKQNMDIFATSDTRICYISTDSEAIGISGLTEKLRMEGQRGDAEKVTVEEALLGMSLETEQKLIQHTVKQRTLAVTKKLTQLLDDIYKSVSCQMEQISRDYENKLALLNRSQNADLNLFVRQEKGERLQHFDMAVKELSEDMEQSICAKAAVACTSVIGNLDNKSTNDQLKQYINNLLSGDCRKQAEILMSEAEDYYGKIQYIFGDEMRLFQASFQKIYRSLDIIPLDMSQSKYDFPQKVEIETADIAGTADYIASQLSSNAASDLGGTAAGAAIGTALAPGIGTIIGGFIGFMMAPNKSVSQIREGCKDKLKPQLTNYYNSVSDKVISAVNRYIRQMRICLSEEIDKYLKRYRSEVDRQIALENNRRSAINTQINELRIDMTGIQNHKTLLASVIAQLNNFGRKG